MSGDESYALGQSVEFTWHVERRTEYREAEHYGRRVSERWRVWKPQAYPGQPEPDPTGGIVVGVRTLANGRAEYEHEAGMIWDPVTAERFRAYLVAYDLRRKPVFVLPEHMALPPVKGGGEQ